MQVSADLRRAMMSGLVITVCSVLGSFVPVYVWLQIDPVLDLASIYASTIILPAVIAPACSFLVLRAQMRAERLARENDRLANCDELTGLPNRRAFFAAVTRLQDQAAAGPGVFVCAIADIDNFKHVNDHYGHDMGDGILQAVGASLQAAAPPGGFVARLGGEEFAFAGVFADAEAAQQGCAALVGAVRRVRFTRERVRLGVTISLGFCSGGEGETISAMLSRADHALYRAKRTGKDRAISADALADEAVREVG